jgi:hypothetical protein
MIHRCVDPKTASYKYYGAKGITVCDRWQKSFANFYADMGSRPSPQHSIERINREGPYSPENCVWATIDIQARNKRNNHFLLIRGEYLTFAESLRKFGVAKTTLRRRFKEGMTPEQAIFTRDRRLRRNNRFLLIGGEHFTFSECLRKFGVAKTTLRRRLKKGMTPEEAVFTRDRRLTPRLKLPLKNR